MNRRKFAATLMLAPFAMRVQAKAARREDLEKKRPCDGVCCDESPLIQIVNLATGRKCCKYHDHTMQFDVNSGCRIMDDPKLLRELTEDELRRFIEGCVGYPIPYAPTAGFGNCCWGKKGEA